MDPAYHLQRHKCVICIQGHYEVIQRLTDRCWHKTKLAWCLLGQCQALKARSMSTSKPWHADKVVFKSARLPEQIMIKNRVYVEGR